MADNPITTPLPADLPEDWVENQIVAPEGQSVGLDQQHGYNYLMEQVNSAQTAARQLGEAFSNLTAADVGAASIGSNGQIPYSQTPHLTGNLTVYVDGTNGSDENSGAYGSPFKTIQAAVDSIPKNLGKYIATIRVADGNYEENIIISGFFGGCFVDYRILSLCVQADNVSDPGVVIKGKIDIVGNASSVSLNYLEIEGTDYACFTRNDVYLYQCKTTGGAHSIISWGGIFKAERCTFIAETYGFSTDTIALIANCTITSEKIGIACGSLGPASTAILVFSNCNITAPTKIGKYNHSIVFEDGVQV